MRIEHDALGSKQISDDVYWGIHTQRALENFPLSGTRVPFKLIQALAMVKKACARANSELGFLSPEKACAVTAVCDEIIAGGLADQFPLDALQGGAGTSTNMNVNEVIAHRGLEGLHPLDDVNMHQSTNDVYPTALRVAAISLLEGVSAAAAKLQGAFQRKEKAFAHIVKIGRTELQDAVPMTLGAEFSAWAEAVARDRWRTFKCIERLRVVNLGGTAIGTGLGAPRDYIFLVIEKLREVTGQGLSRGENVVGETANADAFVEVSGILKAHASNLIKIANDLRYLNASGEIRLPPRQAGSSIMPGKVNPVVAEAVMQAGLKVMANDLLVTEAASRGGLQINEFLPLLASALLESLELLAAADHMLAGYVDGTEADEAKCRTYFDHNRAIVTAFVPTLGYEKCEMLLKAFDASGQENLRVFLTQELGQGLVEEALSPQRLMALGYK